MNRKSSESKSLIEVWEWKERVYEKIKNKADKIHYLQKDTEEVISRLGLKKVSLMKKL